MIRPLFREFRVERSLAWAYRHGCTVSRAALDEYCAARDLVWSRDHDCIITFHPMAAKAVVRSTS